MTQNDELPTKQRLTISITDGSIDDIKKLRLMLEMRLNQRLSIAQVIKRLTKDALEEEMQNIK